MLKTTPRVASAGCDAYRSLILKGLLATTAFVSPLVLRQVPARAAEIQTNIPDLSIRWDTTLTENLLLRTSTPDKTTLANPNTDDTDRNFRGTFAAARTDVYSEVDIKYKDAGIRGSASAWYDPVYSVSNSNTSPQTLNNFAENSHDFQRQAAQIAGYHAEINDLFAYDAFDIGTHRFSFRAGQFAQLWGESLFLATNGIAYGMNPIDGIKGQILLNPQARDIYMGTPQVSVTFAATDNLSLSAYYKFGFRRTRAAPSGTYFSASDTVDVGADKLFVASGSPAYFRRGSDIRPNGLDGQFGVEARYRFGSYDLGLYAIRYDDPTPSTLYLHPGDGFNPSSGQIGSYQLVFARGVQAYAASVSTDIFSVINVGGEISARRNEPLVSAGALAQPNSSNSNNPAYPVGDSLHAQISFIYASPPIRLLRADQLQIQAEFGINHLLGVSQNGAQRAPYTNRTAAPANIVLALNYYAVLPSLDLQPSIGIAPQLFGTSAVDSSERAHTANLSVGLKGTLRQRYTFLLQYRHYIGEYSHDNTIYNNALLGRDFAGGSFQFTF